MEVLKRLKMNISSYIIWKKKKKRCHDISSKSVLWYHWSRYHDIISSDRFLSKPPCRGEQFLHLQKKKFIQRFYDKQDHAFLPCHASITAAWLHFRGFSTFPGLTCSQVARLSTFSFVLGVFVIILITISLL